MSNLFDLLKSLTYQNCRFISAFKFLAHFFNIDAALLESADKNPISGSGLVLLKDTSGIVLATGLLLSKQHLGIKFTHSSFDKLSMRLICLILFSVM